MNDLRGCHHCHHLLDPLQLCNCPAAVADYLSSRTSGNQIAIDALREAALEIKKLKAENTRYRNDSLRLDYLAAHPKLAEIVIDNVRKPAYYYGVAGAEGVKLREIIDALLK